MRAKAPKRTAKNSPKIAYYIGMGSKKYGPFFNLAAVRRDAKKIAEQSGKAVAVYVEKNGAKIAEALNKL